MNGWPLGAFTLPRMIAAGLALLLVWILLYFDYDEIYGRLKRAVEALADAVESRVTEFLDWLGPHDPSPAHPAAKAAARCQCVGCTAELSPVEFAEFERDWRSARPPAPRRET